MRIDCSKEKTLHYSTAVTQAPDFDFEKLIAKS
jgi:hypothetical protein